MTLSIQFPRFTWETITGATDYGIGLLSEALEPGEANTAVPSVHRIAAVNKPGLPRCLLRRLVVYSAVRNSGYLPILIISYGTILVLINCVSHKHIPQKFLAINMAA